MVLGTRFEDGFKEGWSKIGGLEEALRMVLDKIETVDDGLEKVEYSL